MNIHPNDIERLDEFLRACPRLVVLTGAGISLASGIPTYRDQQGQWQHSEPIKHQEFLQEPARRQRYWARSLRGWPGVRDAQPNIAHHALATLEQQGSVEALITQNVDRLHQRAGSRKVIDLHGRLDRVRCLECGAMHSREAIQKQMSGQKSQQCTQSSPRPDGDVELPEEYIAAMRVPSCSDCKGVIMPDVVFFGGTVPKPRVESCMDAVARADGLLVIGSSLQVFSGFRFCRRAAELGKPIAIINPGTTRADDIAQLKLKSDCGPLLEKVASQRAALC